MDICGSLIRTGRKYRSRRKNGSPSLEIEQVKQQKENNRKEDGN